MIELQKFKHSAAFSRATTAFSANVLWNGRLIGYAENDGRGGCARFWADEKAAEIDLEAASAFAKQQTIKVDGETIEIQSLIDWLAELANQAAYEKAEIARLRRDLKKKSVLLWNGDYYTSKAPWQGNEAALRSLFQERHPGCVILSDRPLAEAEQLYLAFLRERAN